MKIAHTRTSDGNCAYCGRSPESPFIARNNNSEIIANCVSLNHFDFYKSLPKHSILRQRFDKFHKKR